MNHAARPNGARPQRLRAHSISATAQRVRSLSPSKQAELVGIGTLGVFVAWLAVACYALAYLSSH